MYRAYVCSPLGGNITANIENAKRYSQYVFKCGMAPVIPHFYALVLNDVIPKKENSVCRQEFLCCGFAMKYGFSAIKLQMV